MIREKSNKRYERQRYWILQMFLREIKEIYCTLGGKAESLFSLNDIEIQLSQYKDK